MRFEDALRLRGLLPGDVSADGRWHRCPTTAHPRKKNGAWKLTLDGRRGFILDFSDGRGTEQWTAEGDYTPTPVDLDRQRQHRDRERLERVRGIDWSRQLWAAGAPFSGHKYLRDKGLTAEGCHVLRLWRGVVRVDGQPVEDTWLLAPLYSRDKLVNVQRISAGGVKRQMKHAPQRGCYLILGRPRWAVTVIVEGLATGLAVFQSMRHARVIVAFFADNLLPVVQEIKPTGSVVFCADNDHQTAARGKGNPGIEKARNAADLIGAGVAWFDDIEGTDAADALVEYGAGGGRRIERLVLAGARYVAGGA